jgi:hypothetical protein
LVLCPHIHLQLLSSMVQDVHRWPFSGLILVTFFFFPTVSLCSSEVSKNWPVVLQFPPVSYVIPGFLQVNYSACCMLHADFLLGLLFNPGDRGDMLLRNVGWLLSDYTLLYPRRQSSSQPLILASDHNSPPALELWMGNISEYKCQLKVDLCS